MALRHPVRNTIATCVVATTAILPSAQAQQEGAQNASDLLPEMTFQGVEITEPTWVLERSKIMSVDGSDAGTATDFLADQQWLILKGMGSTAITLSCQKIIGDDSAPVRLQVAFDLDKSVDVAKRRMRIRHATAKITLGEKRGKSERVIWNIGTMKMAPHSRNVARRVFNAAVRGDRLQFKTQGKTYIDVPLPETNQDFRNFVKACPALQPKPK